MAITRLMANTCRSCHQPLTDAVSRRYRLGPDCRRGMTGEQLRQAMELTHAEARPDNIPPERAPTIDARLTNAAARRTVAEAEAPPTCAAHGGILGCCPQCRHEQLNPAARIIREVKALGHDARRAQRIEVLAARYGVIA